MIRIFEDENKVFSWRKALAFLAGFVFVYAAIASMHGMPELPKTYQMIIAGVFGFYFGKKFLEKPGPLKLSRARVRENEHLLISLLLEKGHTMKRIQQITEFDEENILIVEEMMKVRGKGLKPDHPSTPKKKLTTDE